jgi:hypothetical protein
LSGRGDPQKYAFILIAVVATATAAWLAIEGTSGVRRPPPPVASVRTEPTDAGAPIAALPDAAAPNDDAGLALQPLPLFDGGLLMPSSAPRSVKIGVVLVAFAGAEGAPNGARSKKDALGIADRLLADAKSDFHKAVTSGDTGSSDDIGRLPRGVLDPHTEAVVFALNAGDVSDVLETPRGYWIVKRIE